MSRATLSSLCKLRFMVQGLFISLQHALAERQAMTAIGPGETVSPVAGMSMAAEAMRLSNKQGCSPDRRAEARMAVSPRTASASSAVHLSRRRGSRLSAGSRLQHHRPKLGGTRCDVRHADFQPTLPETIRRSLRQPRPRHQWPASVRPPSRTSRRARPRGQSGGPTRAFFMSRR